MLAALPNLGLVSSPSPITQLPALAQELGLQSLSIKRDDLLPALYGGTKVRKLDYLLAGETYAQASGFVGIGAIGSGLLVALAAAAAQLGKPLHACCFKEHIDDHVRDNFAYTASRADRLDYYGSRAALALNRPSLFTSSHYDGRVIVPPGASNAAATVGVVAAALELKEQVKAGLCPPPTRIIVAMGSGGTAVGLSVGLALAGMRAEIHAVTAIEKAFSREAHVMRLQRETAAWLTRHGVSGTSSLQPAKITIDRSALGKGYGIPSARSIAAVERAREHGVWLESIYSGKAMAALLSAQHQGGHVLFWQTNRGAAPRVERPWSLPPALRHDF